MQKFLSVTVSRKIKCRPVQLNSAASQYVINELLSEFKAHSSNAENSHYKASSANQKQTELKLKAIKALQSNRLIT